LTGSANFGSTINLANLLVYTDPGGTNPANGFQIDAESGTLYPYNAGSEIPEPGSLLLALGGLSLLLARYRSLRLG